LFALNVLDLPLVEARTVATTVLVVVGLYLILALEASGRRRSTAVSSLCLVLGGLYVLVLSVPFTRDFFALAAPGIVVFATALLGGALAVGGLVVTDAKFLPDPRICGSRSSGLPDGRARARGDALDETCRRTDS
jgi:hypothetical protein